MKKVRESKVLRILSLIALCIAMLGGVIPKHAEAADKVTTAREAADGVVLVASESDSAFATGTGFAVGTPGEPVRWIVTNYHVVENAAEENGSIVVYFSAAA
ncbi:MAG: hypothetical protein IJD26_00565, partial [Lachnospiraceae bacterium]|nr:hypothetical protein [Lachnospiraceae bacterium]